MDVASTVDVQCAAIKPDSIGHSVLTFTLNRYAADLSEEISAKKGPLIGRLCMLGGDQAIRLSRDSAAQPEFSFHLSDVPAEAMKQRQCLAKTTKLKASCP
jgi:hypothetical protein